MNTVRNIGIMLALAVLSFVIGFFGLAKLLPAPKTPSMQTTQIAANNITEIPVRVSPSDNPVKTKSPQPIPPVVQTGTSSITQPASSGAVPGRTAALNRGPVLDATDQENGSSSVASDTQKPRSLEGDPPATSSTTQGGSINQPGGIEQSSKRRRHRRRLISPPVEAVPSETETATNAPTANPDSTPDDSSSADAPKSKPKSSYYKVHLGAYQTKEAANRQMEVAKEKGFDTQVLPVTRNGRTLYRVQLGAYKDRDHANTAKQSLDDAGLSGKVSDP